MTKKKAEKATPYIAMVPLSEIERWPRNPKDHDIGALSQSFARFGFVAPLLMDERSGKLVAGHGRLDTLLEWKRRGRPAPAGIEVEPKVGGDWLVPVIRGVAFKSDKEAEAYLLADNQLTAIGGWMDNILAQVLQDHADDLDGTGFDGDDLDRLMKDLYPDDDGEADDKPRISPELFERYDYVVILFENEIDWNRAMELFELETVATGKVGKKGEAFAAQQKGVGRVVKGSDLFRIMDGLRYGGE